MLFTIRTGLSPYKFALVSFSLCYSTYSALQIKEIQRSQANSSRIQYKEGAAIYKL